MPLAKIFKKASNFILRSQTEDSSSSPSYGDGEVVFCKNNVCVHPPALIRQETDILHHPGYLTVTCQVVDERRTLFLSWIPNTTLRKHPSTVEQRSLSVSRVPDTYAKDDEIRRLSASSITFPDHSRRNSYNGYECSGCFPDHNRGLLSLSLSPQMSIRHNKRAVTSSSMSSNSENNSLTLTPTENESIKDNNIFTSGDINDKGSSVSEAACIGTNEEFLSEVPGDCEIKINDKPVVNNCDNLVGDVTNIIVDTVNNSTGFNLDQNLAIKKSSTETKETYHTCNLVDNLENKTVLSSNVKTVVGSNTDQIINVPNETISNDLTTELDKKCLDSISSDDNNLYTETDNNEVPSINNINSNINNNISRINIVGDDDDDDNSTNKIAHENSDKEKDVEIDNLKPRNDSIKKINNIQYAFTRSDGVVYIDSLVLQQNPHILNSSTTNIPDTDSNSSNEVNCTKHTSNCQKENGENAEVANNFIKKKNFDNLKPVDHSVKSLPLRSYEENFAPSWMSSPELLALKHNLSFPESVTASPVIRRNQRCCRKFCVDLSQMRSLRLFFSDAESTKGQLVIASRECQYKILHFHHSGLERLAEILQQWHLLTVVPHCDNLPYRHFMVCRPAVHDNELHPEEGKVNLVTMADWLDMLNVLGQVEDDLTLRKGIFLGGLDPSLRKTVWPFLLHCFSYQSTATEREQILAIRRQEYEQIANRRLSLEGAAKERFIRNIQCVVEKDVIRTDRGNPYYAGECNPHLDVMKSILLNYAVYDSGLGYLQGMSDLLAPLLAEVGTEADTFWCFVGLMRRTIFVCTPTDSDMERNLSYLRELIREMVPEFFKHLERHTDAMELLFCHRWILLCFKREFPEGMVLKMWEACWANYLTDYFNLFLCLAIVSAYADDVIAQDLRTDEMLLHFSSLAMFMDGELILRKARGLLYQFRQRPIIPCTLAGLCRQCGPGMWDSGHAPTIVCRGPDYCLQNPCPHRVSSDLTS